MKTKQQEVRISGACCFIALALASTGLAQTLEERRAAARERSEATIRYLKEQLAEAKARAEERRPASRALLADPEIRAKRLDAQRQGRQKSTTMMAQTAQSFGPTDLWLEIEPATDSVLLTLHNTTPGLNYQILSRQDIASGGWVVEQDLVGADGQDLTQVLVPRNQRPALFFRVATSDDSDGDGLSDVAENTITHTDPFDADTGNTGVSDGYKDTDGDGWSNIDEIRNQTDPAGWNVPAAPQGLTLFDYIAETSATLEWESAAGPVVEYVLERYQNSAWQEIACVSADTTSFVDSQLQGISDPLYRIKADYPAGSSGWSEAAGVTNPKNAVEAVFMRGPEGRLYLAASAIPQNIVTIRVQRTLINTSYATWRFLSFARNSQAFQPGVSDGYFDIPTSSLVNGVYEIAQADAPPFGVYRFDIQAIGNAGDVGPIIHPNPELPAVISWRQNIPFIDGREHLKQNLAFLLRSANGVRPFRFEWLRTFADLTDLFYEFYGNATYAESGFYTFHPYYETTSLNEFQPFEVNHLLRNFVFDAADYNGDGTLQTGVDFSWLYYQAPVIVNPKYFFHAYNYVTSGGSPAIPAVLSFPGSRWIYSHWNDYPYSEDELWNIGVSVFFDAGPGWDLELAANYANIFGLRYNSAKIVVHEPNQPQFLDLPRGSRLRITSYHTQDFFPETETPTLQTISYYFCRDTDAMPGNPNFSLNAVSPLFIASVGKPMAVAGWAKQRIVNGDQTKFAYLGQYFDKAFKVDPVTGLRTTTETGILSEYGEFLPTEPGRVILTTKPDPDQGGLQGECLVHVIKIQLDVNHDGDMESTFAGPDNTIPERPFTFWNNDDVDRDHPIDLGTDREEDDLGPSEINGLPENERVPDFAFANPLGDPAIPCKRDLEDYARLWLPGFSTLMAAVPANYDVDLAWRSPQDPNAPGIRLFRAYENDGGNQYLFNETTANGQTLDFFGGRYIGIVGPNMSIRLSDQFRSIPPGFGGPGDYYIFCGAKRGAGELVLQVKNGAEVIAETSVSIEIKDIKQMYERWTLGESGGVAPFQEAIPATEGLPIGMPAFRYPYNPSKDANTPYVLHVHGWNMQTWDKDRYAETAFKRLYWQGYEGRFGSFRWPTYARWPSVGGEGGLLNHYDRSEWQAWKSAIGLRNRLADLNEKHPGQVRLSAHSMGNVVVGEALRISAPNSPLVAAYAACQAAVPSHCYDPTAPIRSLGTADDFTRNVYAHYWEDNSPPYFNAVIGASRYVNFYNPADQALSFWQFDQNLKPVGTLGYGYIEGTGSFYKDFANAELLFPGDTHQIFSFCAEARCFALGAQAGVQGVFLLQQQVQQVDCDDTFSFGGAHKGHSAQFRSTNMKRGPFWQRLMIRFGLKQEE